MKGRRIPVAIRKPGGKWHRQMTPVMNRRCWSRLDKQLSAQMTEKALLTHTADKDRCRICWLDQR